MKYLKRYNEDIEWEFEDEEINNDFKVGDKVILDGTEYYEPGKGAFYSYIGGDIYHKQEIEDVKLSIGINDTVGKGISNVYDGYLYKIKNKWPWFKINRSNKWSPSLLYY